MVNPLIQEFTVPDVITVEECRKAFICAIEEDFEKLDDGYVYYFKSKPGAIGSFELRAIADELDRRNAEWDAQVKRDLGVDVNHPNS